MELPCHLQEFILALNEEIEAAQKNLASSAVLLSDGQFVASVGASFRYRFNLQTPVRVPPDTEGYLILQSKPDEKLLVTIVEAEDLIVTIAVPRNIGRNIPAARLLTDLTMLLRQLIKRIEEKAQSEHPAADRVLGFRPPTGAPVEFSARNEKLNKEQRDAVVSALGRDITFIWGPPGTGKTQTIGEIGAQLFLRGRTLLMVSHTNTAVDEALIRIADALKSEFLEGQVIRVGEPVKIELANRGELLLRRIAEKRSAELRKQKEALEVERTRIMADLTNFQRLVDIAEWLSESASDLAAFEKEYRRLGEMAAEEEKLEHALAASAGGEPHWTSLQQAAAFVTKKELRMTEVDLALREVETRIPALEAEIQRVADDLRNALEIEVRSREAEPLRIRRRVLPSLVEAKELLASATNTRHEKLQAQEAADRRLREAEELYQRTSSVGVIKRLWLKLPKPEEQAEVMRSCQTFAAQAQTTSEAARQELAAASKLEDEVRQLEFKLSAFAGVPLLAKQQAIVERIREKAGRLEDALERANESRTTLQEERCALAAAASAFRNQYGMNSAEAAEKAAVWFTQVAESQHRLAELTKARAGRERSFESNLRRLLEALSVWRLAETHYGTVAEMLHVLQRATERARKAIAGRTLTDVQTERNRLSAAVEGSDAGLTAIEERLKRVEEELISSARIIATTLTRAYMRNTIQARTFDTVLVDEASMAPIPALWASATLAEQAIVVVGDFKQLPPIVQSEHPVAKRWLGRDVFAASGVQGAFERGERIAHFVPLREQHRMHPEISAIVNELIYDRLLRDGASVNDEKADESLHSWYAQPCHLDYPVTLVDTSSFHAWNTSADRSRLNVLSAMVTSEIVCQMLADNRPEPQPEKGRRILAICPYRPQAKLLQLLSKEDALDFAEVHASTVHSFQGSEADAVVLDLVVDEPHFRTNLTTSAANSEIARLLNVAITRAKRRLIIVTDISWFHAKGRGAFAGSALLPWLAQRHARLSASEVVRSGNTFQSLEQHLRCGGSLDRETPRAIVSANYAKQCFLRDVSAARTRVVVYSPMLDLQAVEDLAGAFSQSSQSGVAVYIVSRPLAEYSAEKRESGVRAESVLRKRGVFLIHKTAMHEKLALLDDDILWCGSSGLLEIPTQGAVMFRRHSRKLVAECFHFLRVNDLTAPYAAAAHTCPICGLEMLAAEAGEGVPFYWRCTEKGCYTRRIGDQPLKDGIIAFSCGGQPAFGYWGDQPYWLCSCGKKHRQKLHKNDLKLPKMRALIPKRSWARACREVGFDPGRGAH